MPSSKETAVPAQTIKIKNELFALLPQAEYEELAARAAGERLPSLPKRDAAGNYPAKEAMRSLIARGIITRRIAAGWTQEGLARRANLSVETIHRIESAQHKPAVETIEKIETVFKRAGV